MKSPKNLWIALAVVAVWLAITIGGGHLQGGGHTELDELVKRGVLWALVAALAFLAVMKSRLRWPDLGFEPADWPSSLRLMWLPLLLIALMLGIAVTIGLPAPAVLGWVLLNTVMVGISEEWAFRGFLLKGLSDRFSIRPAIWWCAALFGSTHALNVLVTGHLGAGVQQAIAAAMSGLLFTVLRVRTRSLYPVMLLHTLWDFAVFVMVSSPQHSDAPGQAPSGTAGLLAPFIVVLPNFLYALYLMRRAEHVTSLDATPNQPKE